MPIGLWPPRRVSARLRQRLGRNPRLRPWLHAAAYLTAYTLLYATELWRGRELSLKPLGWYVALTVQLFPTYVFIRWLTKTERPAHEAVAGLLANSFGLLGFFAIAHFEAGVIGACADPKLANVACRPALSTAIYFSTVTWTTLGYGDLKPIESLQLLAAGEALLGYLYLGLLVAYVAKILKV